jgi:hypothetical protein
MGDDSVAQQISNKGNRHHYRTSSVWHALEISKKEDGMKYNRYGFPNMPHGFYLGVLWVLWLLVGTLFYANALHVGYSQVCNCAQALSALSLALLPLYRSHPLSNSLSCSRAVLNTSSLIGILPLRPPFPNPTARSTAL